MGANQKKKNLIEDIFSTVSTFLNYIIIQKYLRICICLTIYITKYESILQISTSLLPSAK